MVFLCFECVKIIILFNSIFHTNDQFKQEKDDEGIKIKNAHLIMSIFLSVREWSGQRSGFSSRWSCFELYKKKSNTWPVGTVNADWRKSNGLKKVSGK